MKLCILSLISLACLPLWAEPGAGSGKRTCKVLFLNKPVDATKRGYLFDGTSSYAVTLSGKDFSSVVHLPDRPLTVHFSLNPVVEMKDLAQEAPSVQLPEETTDFYLILRSAPEGVANPYSLEVADISNGKLKAGETLWMNLTTHHISATLGDESFPIPPKGRVVSPAPLENDGYYPVKFSYKNNGEGEYLDAMNKTWRFQVKGRSLGFILDTGGRRPEIFTILDRR